MLRKVFALWQAGIYHQTRVDAAQRFMWLSDTTKLSVCWSKWAERAKEAAGVEAWLDGIRMAALGCAIDRWHEVTVCAIVRRHAAAGSDVSDLRWL